MAKQRKLRLRGAARYTITSIQKDPILRGNTITVDDATAEKLLKEHVRDRANNAWPIFQDVTNEGEASVEGDVVKPKRTRRRRAVKKTDTAESAAA